jgi:hypothetical protein
MTPDGLEKNLYFGGGGDTSISLIGICILILASLLILVLPRRYMIVPFLVASLLMPNHQSIVILGAHLMISRMLIFVAWVRIAQRAFLTRRDPFPSPMNVLDKVFISWAVCGAIMYTLLWHVVGAFVNRLGFLYTTLGVYFLFRYLIRDREDVFRVIKTLSLVVLPIAIAMWVEHSTGRNPLSILGGIEEYSNVRDGAVRAQGPFLHSIVAGTFGAMQVPLFIALWLEGKGNRLAAGLGVISCTVITIASASSTPVMTYCAAVGALCFWPLRDHMRTVRWALVSFVVMLQIAMQAPIWFLMNRISGVLGGTGWHRAELINQFVRRFFEWWLVGTQNNANWGLDMWDSINAYVKAGVEGGLITFILFLSIFVFGYKRIGSARRIVQNDLKNERLIWALGATLFGNTIAFFGIIYFDQSAIAWYLVLATISVVTALAIEQKQEGPESENELSASLHMGFSAQYPRPGAQGLPSVRNRHSSTAKLRNSHMYRY